MVLLLILLLLPALVIQKGYACRTDAEKFEHFKKGARFFAGGIAFIFIMYFVGLHSSGSVGYQGLNTIIWGVLLGVPIMLYGFVRAMRA